MSTMNSVKVSYSIAPSPRFLDAMRNHSWSPSAALAELVDNSLGEARGNAMTVCISWDERRRRLIVLDDGNGMKEVGRLFHLGSAPVVSPNDIGKYGSGGTLALLWLAERVTVTSVRNGAVSKVVIDWPATIAGDAFPRVPNVWEPVTPANTPDPLLALEHGTLIEMEIDGARRRISPSNIRRDLAATYALAIKAGKRLLWSTNGERPNNLASEMPRLDRVIRFELNDIGGTGLSASGEVGTSPNLSSSLKGFISVGFGHRLIMRTTDCFKGHDGERFDGSQITGWVFLGPGWREHLTATKDNIASDSLREALMEAIYAEIRPLLEMLQSESLQLVLHGVQSVLSKALGSAFRPHVEVTLPGNIGKADVEHTGGHKNRGKGILTIRQRSDAEMDMCLFRSMEVSGCVEVEINRDHSYVRALLDARHKLPHGLYVALLREVSATIVGSAGDQLLRKVFGKDRDILDAIEYSMSKEQLVLRKLVDKVEE